MTSLQNYGSPPLIPISAQSFLETLFGLSADVKYDPAYDQPTVQAEVLQTLSQAFGFAARTFGQGVSVDEVATVMQAVPGVVAVNVKEVHTVATSTGGDLAGAPQPVEVDVTHFAAHNLPSRFRIRRRVLALPLASVIKWRSLILPYPLERPQPQSVTRIYPYLPVANPKSAPQPAEILVLDPAPGSVVLGVMS